MYTFSVGLAVPLRIFSQTCLPNGTWDGTPAHCAPSSSWGFGRATVKQPLVNTTPSPPTEAVPTSQTKDTSCNLVCSDREICAYISGGKMYNCACVYLYTCIAVVFNPFSCSHTIQFTNQFLHPLLELMKSC